MPSSRFRQRVRLLVLDHLQAMFERAQDSDRHPSDRRRRLASRARARKAPRAPSSVARGRKRRIAAAEDQLLGLGEEFDLADAAAAELDVVACDRDRAVAAMGVDLALDRMDVLDRGVVEIAPPDEGLDRFEETRAGRPDRRRRRAP